MRRVNLLGVSASGVDARAALAARLGVPFVEVDALHHGPNWQEASPEELRAKVEEAMAASEGWVLGTAPRAQAR